MITTEGGKWGTMGAILLMNLVVVPLLILWTLFCILISPIIFLSVRFLTGWPKDRIIRLLVWLYGRGWLVVMAPFVRFRREGLDTKDVQPPCILVVNHLSFFDTYCMALLPFSNVVFAIRDWPFKIPWYRPFMQLANYLNVEKLSWDDIQHRANVYLQNNAAVLFFPEGHRNRDGNLQRFHTGAFKVAVETQTKLVPLVISGTDTLLPPGRWWLKPAQVTLKALEPIDASKFSGKMAHRDLSRIIKNRMRWALNLPVGTSNLLPHQPPMRTVDRIVALTEKEGSVEYQIDPDHIFLDQDGHLDPIVYLEMMAQSFAAIDSYRNRTVDGEPREGFLVGVRDFQVAERVITGGVLTINVAISRTFAEFTIMNGEVHHQDNRVASAILKLWIPKNTEHPDA